MATNAPTPLLTPPAAPPGPGLANAPAATNALALQDIHDIKPPVAIPDWTWLWWTLGGLILGVLLGWWWWRWRRRQKPAAVEVDAKELVPPHVRAKERLTEALKFIGQPKPFCIAVSDALRRYLEEQFDLHAPERTTEEFLDEVQASPQLDAAQKRLLADFLNRCDLVKFAKETPAEPELRELHEVALRLVIETEPSRSADRLPDQPPEAVASSAPAKPAAPPSTPAKP